MFITAIKAQVTAQLATFEPLEKEEILQQGIDAKKSAEVIAQDRQERDAMIKRAKDLSLDAARKSAEAAAIVANAHIISPSQISGLDLFGVTPGETEVTGYSGSSSSGAQCDPYLWKPEQRYREPKCHVRRLRWIVLSRHRFPRRPTSRDRMD